MNRYQFTLIFCTLLSSWGTILAQNGIIKGRVYDQLTNEPLPFGSVFLQESKYGAYTDSSGSFIIQQINPGLYNLEVRYAGYKTQVEYEIQVTNSKPYVLEIGMSPEENQLDSVNIVASPFKEVEESPLSLKTIGTSEIKRYPGGNRDISKVIQALPGVASRPTFRNDIIIRGGAPNENRFYIDGIETPNINHFATQGASGGPVGMLNVDLIGETDFYSGAFPANRGNTLSSVLEFRQREARDDRLGFTATVGATDLALTLEGPTGDNSSFLFSARRSYLQFLFQVLGLPFLPTYNDFQYKHKFNFGERHQLTLVGLAAIDEFELNTDVDSTEAQIYQLNNIPVNNQWNYTVGASYKYFGDKGFWNVVLSRNMINFDAIKYLNNDESSTLLLDYNSQESENKLRIERTARAGKLKWNYGANYEFARYTNSTFNRTRFGVIDFESAFNMNKYGAFAQVSQKLLEDRLILSLGARIDGNDFSSSMSNPLEQFSPRFSVSYAIAPNLKINANTGIYYQLPPYTVLGYRDSDTGELANTDITYIRNNQVVAGISWTTVRNTKIAIEGYFKGYQNYPFLTRDSISLANLGGDFGTIGNEPAESTSDGRAYGMELLIQQRLYKGFYGILAYTLGWSEFKDNNGEFVPSSWDNRHIVSLTAGKKFGKDWELGARWRFTSGIPFTPADVETSSLIRVWDVRQREVPDYDRLNQGRLANYTQLDVRLDKKWFFKKWSLNLFLDIQNIYNSAIDGQPILDTVKDENDQPIVDPTDPSRYQMFFIDDELGILQPTIGIVVTY
ncbi:MAG: TonB-dependent receptor [Bacteroidota bacterium]